jgi:hypothetical protein
MKAFSGYSVLVAVVLNCPIFSHKGDSSKKTILRYHRLLKGDRAGIIDGQFALTVH